MGYKPKKKDKFSNFFPTNYKVDYAQPIEDKVISQVTYGTPTYAPKLETVIDAAKADISTAPAPVATASIATVTNAQALDGFIASNAYSNRASYYQTLETKLKESVKTMDNAFQAELDRNEAAKVAKAAADAKALSDEKAKAEAKESLKQAALTADLPSTKEVEAVTPVAKAKKSNALMYIGVIAIGIVGIMLLRNK